MTKKEYKQFNNNNLLIVKFTKYIYLCHDGNFINLSSLNAFSNELCKKETT